MNAAKTVLPKWNIVLTLHTQFAQFVGSIQNMKQLEQTVSLFSELQLHEILMTAEDIIYDDEYRWRRHSLPETLNIDVLWNKSSMKEIIVHCFSWCLSFKNKLHF